MQQVSLIAASSDSPSGSSKGSKLFRSETVTVRLDPKLKYMADLAARRQRRTVSSYVEWAVEASLGQVFIDEHGETPTSIADVANVLWDIDESDRFAKLALRYPDILNYEEQAIWKLIQECGALWRGWYDKDGQYDWFIEEKRLKFPVLREHWDTFKAVARKEATPAELPTWTSYNPMHDKGEIPF